MYCQYQPGCPSSKCPGWSEIGTTDSPVILAPFGFLHKIVREDLLHTIVVRVLFFFFFIVESRSVDRSIKMVNIGRFFLFFAILFFLPFFLVLNQPNMTRKNLEADAHPVKEQDCKGFYTKRQEGEKTCKEGVYPIHIYTGFSLDPCLHFSLGRTPNGAPKSRKTPVSPTSSHSRTSSCMKSRKRSA